MDTDQIKALNAEFHSKSPREILTWALAHAGNRAVISTNFRPYEAVILHCCAQLDPVIPVLWVDHGFNRAATYRHAEQLVRLLKLNLKVYLPKMSAAHWDAIHGSVPTKDDEGALKEFSARMKLEPFQRGMKELAPKVWITALRKSQNPHRAELDIATLDRNFGVLKISPLFYWSDADMETYLAQNHLPIEWDYFDPAKADEARECGLHAAWGGAALTLHAAS